MEEIEQVKKQIESLHGGTATFVQSVPVTETFEGKVAWDGIVHVFDLKGNKKATRAYGWGAATGSAAKHRYFAIIGTPPINSPLDAVRAAIVQEYRESKV